MNTFFDETGSLNLDELILQQPSFRQIMADGVVTEQELQDQSSRVTALLRRIEQTASPAQIDQIRELLAEISVLVAARGIYEKQQKHSDYEANNLNILRNRMYF